MDKINNIGLSRLLTSVYDFDGFTEQEVWCRIAQKINIIIEHFNYLDKKIENEKENNKAKFDYLLGEGLTEAVAKIILEKIADGTLGKLINETLLQDINNKIDENIEKVNGQLDTNKKELNNKIDILDKNQNNLFIPTLSRPIDIAGINNSNIDWIKNKESVNNYLENNLLKFGIKNIQHVINVGYNSLNKLFISYNNVEFETWQDCFTHFKNLCKEKGIEIYTIKIHSLYKENEINDKTGLEDYINQYNSIVSELCEFYSDVTDKCIVFNELEWLYNNPSYNDKVISTFNTVKSKFYKVGISTISPMDYIYMTDALKNAMSFYSTNYYPSLSDNGVISISKMVKNVLISNDYRLGINEMIRSGKQIFISETGCMDKLDGLMTSWKYDNFVDVGDNKGQVQKAFIDVMVTLLNDSRFTNVCYWFNLNTNLCDYVKNLVGGK